MLPAGQRLRSRADFTPALRGVRVGRRTLVVHAARSSTCKFGFIVSRSVGNAVVRNKVKRRLRALAAGTVPAAAATLDVVVRALPPAADATFADLSTDFRSALAGAEARLS